MKKEKQLLPAYLQTNRQLVVFLKDAEDPQCSGEAFIVTPHDYSEREIRSCIRIAMDMIGCDVDSPKSLAFIEDELSTILGILRHINVEPNQASPE